MIKGCIILQRCTPLPPMRLGKVFTATAERAGKGSLKTVVNLVHGSEIVHVCEKNGSFDNSAQVDAGFFQDVAHVGERLAGEFFDASPSAKSPVAGSTGNWPETNTDPLASIAWLYGPMALGALSVFNAFILFLFNGWFIFFYKSTHFKPDGKILWHERWIKNEKILICSVSIWNNFISLQHDKLYKRFKEVRHTRMCWVDWTFWNISDRDFSSRWVSSILATGQTISPQVRISVTHALLWVVTLSTIMLIALQHNVAHLGIVTGLCLSGATEKYVPKYIGRRSSSVPCLASISTSMAEDSWWCHRLADALRHSDNMGFDTHGGSDDYDFHQFV